MRDVDQYHSTVAGVAGIADSRRPDTALSVPPFSAQPPALSAESTALESMVRHRWSIAHDAPLEGVHQLFRDRDVDFMALLRDGRVAGLCSRAKLGFLLGSRYGFALYSRGPASMAQIAHPLVVVRGAPVRQVLDTVLARTGDAFHDDVILVDGDHQLLGLIPVEALANLQTRLVGEQLEELRRQHERLRRQGLEQFQASHALRQTQGLYQGLFESLTLGVALLDVNGTVQAHNRRLAELLNFDADPTDLRTLPDWVIERDRSFFRETLLAHEREGVAPATHEFTLLIPQLGPRLFRISTGWIQETSQICACLEDITHQRALERNMRNQEKQLLLDTLVGGIAHELNNKLAPVMGFADLLGAKLDEQSQVFVGYIRKSTVEAANIIRQLLQLSKPDSGHVEALDLRKIVEESLMLLKFQLRESRASVQTGLPSEPVTVMADGAQLKQVLMNLVINALHAMEKTAAPSLAITVRRRGDTALLTVTDNGTGIPPEIIGRIFDPFFTTKGPEKGSGLGLSICTSIARKHGGDISVESESGGGASFTLSLPLANAATPAVILAADGSLPPLLGARLSRRQALVVEDEEVLRLLKQEIIRGAFGCRVDVAATGVEGLALAGRTDYDLIISDIRMPEMSGIEFYQRVRQLKPDLAGRFLFVSGHAGEKHTEAEVRRCQVPLIGKPFSAKRLVEACSPFLQPAAADAQNA